MTYAKALCLLRVLLISSPNEEVRNSFSTSCRSAEGGGLLSYQSPHHDLPCVLLLSEKKELKVFVKDAVSQMDLTDKKHSLIQEGQKRARGLKGFKWEERVCTEPNGDSQIRRRCTHTHEKKKE